jgi:hypothetical protein
VSFVHDDREFGDLLRIVAGERRIAPGLIEKDYWVTHTLWALHDMGFDVWFKGGTSLSKGFGLVGADWRHRGGINRNFRGPLRAARGRGPQPKTLPNK